MAAAAAAGSEDVAAATKAWEQTPAERTEDPQRQCPICLRDKGDDCVELPCGHPICKVRRRRRRAARYGCAVD